VAERKSKGASRQERRGGRIQRLVSHPALWLVLVVACLLGAAGWLLSGCGGWEPDEPFTRNSPDVDRALELYEAGQFDSAEEVLEAYLGTGPCSDGSIGLPPAVRDKYSGSFDLGLTLFSLAEKYGRRFGEEELDDGVPEDEALSEKRRVEIDCAQIITEAIAADLKVPVELRARAYYLSGNLELLRRQYEDAVARYDKALALVPGLFPEAGGDGIGRDAAWNRAIALRRIQEQQDAGQDAEPDADQDADQPDAQPDSGDDGGDDGGAPDSGDDGGDEDGGGQDAGDGGQEGGSDDEDGGGQDAGDDGGDQDQEEPEPEGPIDEPPGEPEVDSSQIERMLDELEEAPTYQEQDAKRRAAKARRRRVMEDK